MGRAGPAQRWSMRGCGEWWHSSRESLEDKGRAVAYSYEVECEALIRMCCRVKLRRSLGADAVGVCTSRVAAAAELGIECVVIGLPVDGGQCVDEFDRFGLLVRGYA